MKKNIDAVRRYLVVNFIVINIQTNNIYSTILNINSYKQIYTQPIIYNLVLMTEVTL